MRRQRIASTLLGGAVALSLLALALPAGANPGYSIKVTPDTGLVKGETVTVTGSGFPYDQRRCDQYVLHGRVHLGCDGSADCHRYGTLQHRRSPASDRDSGRNVLHQDQVGDWRRRRWCLRDNGPPDLRDRRGRYHRRRDGGPDHLQGSQALQERRRRSELKSASWRVDRDVSLRECPGSAPGRIRTFAHGLGNRCSIP